MIINISGYDIKIDDEDYFKIISKKWIVSKYKNYFRIRNYYYENNKQKHINLHHFVLNFYNLNYDVDHKDGDIFNVSKLNLRICSHQKNMFNQKIRHNNTTGFKGVSFDSRRNKYRGYISINGKQIFLGYHNSAENAAIAYNKKAKELFGEFACLNILKNYL